MLLLEQERTEYLALITGATAAGVSDFPAWEETQAEFDRQLRQSAQSDLGLLRELGVA